MQVSSEVPDPHVDDAGGVEEKAQTDEDWELEAATEDIPGFYFNLMLPPWVSCYMALEGMACRELRRYLISLGYKGELQPDTDEALGLMVVPMGWSWGVWCAQYNVTEAVFKGGDSIVDEQTGVVLTRQCQLVQGKPIPLLGFSKAFLSVFHTYIDDFGVFCITRRDAPWILGVALRLKELMKKGLAAYGLGCHKEESCLGGGSIPCLGVVVGGRPLRVTPLEDKLERGIWGTFYLAKRGWSTPLETAAVVGFWSWQFRLRNSCYAVFDEVYAFIRLEPGDENRFIPRKVLDELVAAMGVAPCCLADLMLKYGTEAWVTDASPTGGAVIPSVALVRELQGKPSSELGTCGSKPFRQSMCSFGSLWILPLLLRPWDCGFYFALENSLGAWTSRSWWASLWRSSVWSRGFARASAYQILLHGRTSNDAPSVRVFRWYEGSRDKPLG